MPLHPLMPEIERHVGEIVNPVPALVQQLVHQVAKVALVLRGGRVELAGHFGGVGAGVVAHAEEFDEFGVLGGREGGVEEGGSEGYDDFAGGGVWLAHVGCVAEAERLGGCWGFEGAGLVCEIGDCGSAAVELVCHVVDRRVKDSS